MTAHDPFAAFDGPKDLAAKLREKLGLSAAYASQLANGKREPSLTLAVRIEDALGIPTAAWLNRGGVQQAKAA